jgi:hypothetical protein
MWALQVQPSASSAQIPCSRHEVLSVRDGGIEGSGMAMNARKVNYRESQSVLEILSLEVEVLLT